MGRSAAAANRAYLAIAGSAMPIGSTLSALLRQVEAVGVHHLGPGRDEVADELLLVALLGIDLGGRAQLAVRPEDQVGPGRAPLLLLAAAVVADELLVAALVDHLPEGVVVEQVDEEVVGQLALAVGEDAVRRVLVVGAEHAQAAEQHRHLRRRQAEQRGAVEQQLLGPHRMLGLEIVAEAVGRRLHHRRSFRRRSIPASRRRGRR